MTLEDDDANEDIDNLHTELNDLRAQLAAAEAERDKWVTDAQFQRQRADAAEQERDAVKAMLAAQIAKDEPWELTIAELRGALTAAEQRLTEVTNQLDAARATLEIADRDRVWLETRNAKLGNEFSAAEQRVKNQQALLDELAAALGAGFSEPDRQVFFENSNHAYRAVHRLLDKCAAAESEARQLREELQVLNHHYEIACEVRDQNYALGLTVQEERDQLRAERDATQGFSTPIGTGMLPAGTGEPFDAATTATLSARLDEFDAVRSRGVVESRSTPLVRGVTASDDVNVYSTKHPHEPDIPPSIDSEGRCRVCELLCQLSQLRERERALMAALVGQIHNTMPDNTPCFCCPLPFLDDGEEHVHDMDCLAARAALTPPTATTASDANGELMMDEMTGVNCPECQGSGTVVAGDDEALCPVCHGQTYIAPTDRCIHGNWQSDCRRCPLPPTPDAPTPAAVPCNCPRDDHDDYCPNWRAPNPPRERTAAQYGVGFAEAAVRLCADERERCAAMVEALKAKIIHQSVGIDDAVNRRWLDYELEALAAAIRATEE